MSTFVIGPNHGIDQVASLDISIGNVAQMGRDEKLTARRRLDEIAFACEEELDFEDAHRRSKLPYPRPEQAQRALGAKNALFNPGSSYSRLREGLRDIAQTDLELREVDVRDRQADYERYSADPDVKTMKADVGRKVGEKKVALPAVGEVGLDKLHGYYYDPREEVREATYGAFRQLDDIEAVALPVIDKLDQKVRSGSRFLHFLEIAARQTELPDTPILEQMMRDFVAGTKDVYERLFRELISTGLVKPWNLDFIISEKDPFFRARVPTDAPELFRAAVDLLRVMGYPDSVIDLYNPQKPGVFMDLEERDGKFERAVTYSLGAFSLGKTALLYNPRTYKPLPRERWKVLHHELARGVHYEMSRRAALVHGAAFFSDGSIASTTITSIHKALAMQRSFWSNYIQGVDEEQLHKWNVFSDLRRQYGNITLAVGEILMHRNGVDKARDAFHEAMKLTRSDLVQPAPVPSSSYIATSHLWNTPGALFPYAFGDFYAVVVVQKMRDEFCDLPCRDAGPFLMEKLMTGNVTPLHQRVLTATGTADIVGNAIQYFNDAVK